MEEMLIVNNLVARLSEKADAAPILNGLSLTVRPGEVHAIMGLNGSGKSTFAKVLAGHPQYEVTGGDVQFKGQSLLELEPDERARLGVFLAFQYPMEIPGVSILNFLRTAYQARFSKEIPVIEFRKLLLAKMTELGMDHSFASRHVNAGFSGGEKKRHEILQMSLLDPALSVMDETDSGLDIDALKTVAQGVNALRNGERAFIVITHYQRLLSYIEPDYVHVVHGGRIVESGGKELALKLEEQGYDWLVGHGKAA